MQPVRFFWNFALVSFQLLGLFFAFTLIIDPYGVSPLSTNLEYINRFKPARVDIDRLIKPLEVWKHQPRTIFLGSSRIQQGFDPSVMTGSRFAPAYNASIPASSVALNVSNLKTYVALDRQLKTVVFELFLYPFIKSKSSEFVDQQDVQTFNFFDNAETLFVSWDALKASGETLFYNLVTNAPVYEIKPGGYFYYPPGHNAKGPFDGFSAGIWKLQDTRPEMQLNSEAFQSLHEIVELCRSKNLELILLLTPNHAYDDFYIDAVGAWSLMQEWLYRISGEATVYSFSQPNEWIDEPVSSHMTYWNDPYHFSLEMGRQIQLALIGGHDGGPDNFLVRLTPDRVASHIEQRREAIRRWATGEKEFARRFEEERIKWMTSKENRNH
jgi:hypothetical protein